MLDEFVFGRQDADSASECGSPDSLPAEGSYSSHLQSLGLAESEVVAMASVDAFNVVRDPSQARWSTHPKFDTFYFKELLNSSSDVSLPHKQELLSGPLREHVELFAESKKDYDASFKSGFVKLC